MMPGTVKKAMMMRAVFTISVSRWFYPVWDWWQWQLWICLLVYKRGLPYKYAHVYCYAQHTGPENDLSTHTSIYRSWRRIYSGKKLVCKNFRSQKHDVGILFWWYVWHPLCHMTLPNWHAVDRHLTGSQKRHIRDALTIRWLLMLLSHSSTYRLIIQSNGTVVKPGYTALYRTCAFFLIRGYFIGHLVIFPPLLIQITILSFCFISLGHASWCLVPARLRPCLMVSSVQTCLLYTSPSPRD